VIVWKDKHNNKKL